MKALRIFRSLGKLFRAPFSCFSSSRTHGTQEQEEKPWWKDITPQKLTERLFFGDERERTVAVEWLCSSGAQAVPCIHFLLSQEQFDLGAGSINQNLLAEIIRLQKGYLSECQNGIPVLVQFIKRSERETSVTGGPLPGVACQAAFEVLNALALLSAENSEQLLAVLVDLLAEVPEHFRFMLIQVITDAAENLRLYKPEAEILTRWYNELQIQLLVDRENETRALLAGEYQEHERTQQPLQLRGQIFLLRPMVAA